MRRSCGRAATAAPSFAPSTAAKPGLAGWFRAPRKATFATSRPSTRVRHTSCPSAPAISPGSTRRPTAEQPGRSSTPTPIPRAFSTRLAFWDPDHGLALGDPVAGHFVILTTDDAGKTWTRIASSAIPSATTGEGAFAASGTCLVVQGDKNAWFATGAGRVFRTTDRGRNWTVHQTPIRAGNGSAGIFSLAFWDADHGVATGGDFKDPDKAEKVCALTSDGGHTWRLPKGSQPTGYRSAVVRVPDSPGPTLLAVGPTGTDRSTDGGENWTKLSPEGFHAVAFGTSKAGWAVGERGRIACWTGKSVRTP